MSLHGLASVKNHTSSGHFWFCKAQTSANCQQFAAVQAPLEGVSRISGRILMDPPVLCILGIREDEGGGREHGAWVQELRKVMVRPKPGFPPQVPRQGQRGLSEAQERTRTSDVCVFASTYDQLSL